MLETTAAIDAPLVYRALPHQFKVLTSDKPITFLGAGIGAGKTDVGALRIATWSQEMGSDVMGVIAANTYDQLFKATLRNLLKNLKRFRIPHHPTILPASARPIDLRIWNGSGWTEWMCRSLEHYEALSGIEIGKFWADEAAFTKREAIDILLARNRDTRVFNQGLVTTTLDDPASWMYELFVENFDAEQMLVLYAPSHANPHLPDGYLERLRSLYSGRYYQRMVEARWVSLEAGQVYHAFGREWNESAEADFEPALPICWTHDFNIGQGKPMSSALCQIRKGPGLDGKLRPELSVFDELVLESTDTHDAVREFEARRYAPPDRVVIYGDATGKSRDTRSKTTDYGILHDAGFVDQRVPAANPPIRERHNVVNSLLKSADGDVRIKVHPRCRTVLKGLETVKLRGGASYLEEETREQHVTTALGYLCCREFPIQAASSTSEFWF